MTCTHSGLCTGDIDDSLASLLLLRKALKAHLEVAECASAWDPACLEGAKPGWPVVDV